MTTSWKKYLGVFILTLLLFLTGFYFSNYLNNKRVEQIKNIQDKISVDILSLETQFTLLSNLSCKFVKESSLSQELNSLAQKIEFSEQNITNSNKDELIQLKKLYSLLEIKDYLLMQKIGERCGTKYYSTFYFYTTEENCSECVKQGYVLTALREKYPDLRVYSFDYSLNLSALGALISIYKIEDTKLPAIVINEKVLTGFQSIEDIEKSFPELVKKQKEEAKDQIKK